MTEKRSIHMAEYLRLLVASRRAFFDASNFHLSLVHFSVIAFFKNVITLSISRFLIRQDDETRVES